MINLSDSVTGVPTWRSPAFWYCNVLLFAAVAVSGATEVAAKYLFKNHFELRPVTIATLNMVVHFPWYLGFVAGALRDRFWSPRRAEGWVMFCGPVTAAAAHAVCFAASANAVLLVLSLLLLTAAAAVYGAVVFARIGVVATRSGLTGRVGAMMNVLPFVAYGLMQLLTARVLPRCGFGGVCAASVLVSLSCVTAALWRAGEFTSGTPLGGPVRTSVPPEPESEARRPSVVVVVVALIAGFWSFIPGWKTPLFFTMTNERGFGQRQFETMESLIFLMAGIVALSYLWLCRRYRLHSLLNAGLLLGGLGSIGIYFSHTYATACLACAVFGASAGVGNAALGDLTLRAAPRKREGVSLMLTLAGIILFMDLSDLAGSALFERGGFGIAIFITAAIPAILLIPVARLPSRITDRAEAVPQPA